MRREVTNHGNRTKSERVGAIVATYNREWDGRQSRTVHVGVWFAGVVSRRPHSSSYVYSAMRSDGTHKGAISSWVDALTWLIGKE